VKSPLIWLSGAQQDILARCKADRPKYTGIGSAVLITAAMAAISMTFALHFALRLSLPVAIPFALGWGIAILSLDRWLVVSLSRQQNRWNYLLLALPRVALGVLFGLIISTPFTLQIFAPEITQQITKIQQQQADTYYKTLASDPLTRKISADQARVGNDEAVIRSGGTAGQGSAAQNSTVATLTTELNQATSAYNTDFNKWHCEIYGFPGHCKMGDGPAAQQDQVAYEADERQVTADRTQLAADEQQITTADKSAATKNVQNATKDLAADKVKLSDDQAEQARLEGSFNNANANDAGLLLRLQALDEVTAGSGELEAARWLLFFFFTAIECLPILVKVLLNLGPPNTYEKALAQSERVGLRLAEQESLRQYREAMMASDALDEESEHLHSQWRSEVLPNVVDATTAARRRVALARLARWERRAQAGGEDDGWAGPGNLSGIGRLPETDWTGTRPPTVSRLFHRLKTAWQSLYSPAAPQEYPLDYPRTERADEAQASVTTVPLPTTAQPGSANSLGGES
jgi:hypothetical protein